MANAVRYPEPPDYVRAGGLRGAIRLFGPGAIIASVTIGSGETLFASRCGAIFGYTLLWFIVAGVVCKLIQVYTAGRYMVLTGEHPMEAWARLPGPRGWFPALLGALSIFCFPFWLGGLAMMLGTTLNWIFGLDGGSVAQQRFYAQLFGTGTLTLAAVLTLLQSYDVLERVQTGIVAVLLVAILAAVIPAPVDWAEAARGAVVVKWPSYAEWMHADYPSIVNQQSVLMVAVVFMGAIGGGTYDYIGYLSFYREKKWGALGLNEAEAGSEAVGGHPVIEADAANVLLGRQWTRTAVVDVFTGFVCVLLFTFAFYLLGAAILHPGHLVPDRFSLLTHQVRFLTQFGRPFKYLYQIGIFMAFWGTIYGAFEIYSRTAYECFRPLVARVRRTPFARLRLPVCLYAGIGGMALMWTVSDPLKIVEPAALIGTTTCGLWCFAMVWADRKVLPGGLRIGVGWVLLNLVAGSILTGFGATAIWDYFF
ncbi:MAG: Nramp family divalent metal transporter [Phycisphaerae bacterium]|nr:Nramp family divalent metal transporter [Phycisphaerae bacterium]